MANLKGLKVDFTALRGAVQSQFVGLNPNDPSMWPVAPKVMLGLVLGCLVLVGMWFVWLSSYDIDLEAEQAKEQQLKQDYIKKVGQAANLDALKKQREQVQHYVTQLEKQLPSKAEMDALLSDINQAGLGRSLQFDLFRPGQVSVKEYYAELPIAVRVTGKYHDIGAFAADVAQLSRIVTLNSMTVMPTGRDGTLSMDTTAKTFRYLDPDEVVAQRKASGGGKK